MVFYRGRAPGGSKTDWKMNEYRALEGDLLPGSLPKLRNEFSLCRVYKNSGTMRSFDRKPSMASTSQNPTSTDHPSTQASSSSDPGSSNPPSTQEPELDLKMLEEFDWDQFDWLGGINNDDD
ncbi:uncharacterized protein A4U43_C03F7350 [Asparagus officinalis]|uniref:NAC domain-containing protein n=1 Tax=Asparagus officinalis TaxID=4686 RepID=A0A5P1F9X8_ASPOF|nr:uncharacterized protein A4U43_C03F7350 [Asparagus officinalis]